MTIKRELVYRLDFLFLTLVLVVLKTMGVVEVSWLWVLAPLWIAPVLALSAMTVFSAMLGVILVSYTFIFVVALVWEALTEG